MQDAVLQELEQAECLKKGVQLTPDMWMVGLHPPITVHAAGTCTYVKFAMENQVFLAYTMCAIDCKSFSFTYFYFHLLRLPSGTVMLLGWVLRCTNCPTV